MSSPKKQFNIMLDPEHLKHLQEVADALSVNKAHAFRMTLAFAHKHIILNIKCCADGRPCFVPHLHPVAAAPNPPPQPNTPEPA